MKKGNRREYEIRKCKYREVRDEEKYLYLKQLYKIKSSSDFIKVFTFGLTATLKDLQEKKFNSNLTLVN